LLTLELEILNSEIPEDGIVTAPETGYLSAIHVQKGQFKMGGEKLATIIPHGSEPYVLWHLPMDKAKNFDADARAIITYQRGDVAEAENRAMPIASLKWDGSVGAFEFTASIGSDDMSLMDQTASVTITQRSDTYEMVVPYSAIHGSENDHYVFMLTFREAVFGGWDSFVRKVDVEVIDDNGRFAAIYASGLQSYDTVVTEATGFFANGDAVRIG